MKRLSTDQIRRLGILSVSLACLWFAGAALYVSGDFGATLEEVAGLTPVPVGWEQAERSGPAESRTWSMRLSPGRPVWGLESPSGSYLPVMVDVHIGAVSFYPLRAAAAVGGIQAARTLHIAFGVAAILATMLAAGALFGRGAGVLASVFLATSPVFLLVHIFARPDVQGAFLYPMLGVLLLFGYARSRSTALLCASAFLFGLGAATKNTALWTAAAAAASIVMFGGRPRGWREATAAAAVFLLPLLPQACLFAFTPSYGQLVARIGGGGSFLDAFSLDRLSFFATHFIVSVAGFGSGAGGIPSAGGSPIPLRAWVVGVFLVAAVIASPFAILLSGPERRRKMFAAGFLLLCAQYLAFYYTGDTYFLLVLPWMVVSLAGVSSLAWRASPGVQVPAGRKALRAAVAVVWACILANQAVEAARFVETVSSKSFAFMRLSVQRELAQKLEERHIERPWTVSYTFAGVMEQLSDGKIKPRHAYNIVRSRCMSGKNRQEAYVAAWDEVFARMGGGIHYVAAQPNPSVIDMNPCPEGGTAVAVLERAVSAKGGSVTEIFSVGQAGSTGEFKVYEIRFP